jgi:hypothetical protein
MLSIYIFIKFDNFGKKLIMPDWISRSTTFFSATQRPGSLNLTANLTETGFHCKLGACNHGP